MKKRIRCLLLVLLFCLVLCVSAAAAEQTGAQLSYVTDAAGLLSENENMLLEKMAPSNTCFRASIHKAVKSLLSKHQVPKNWTTIFFGVAKNIYQKEVV